MRPARSKTLRSPRTKEDLSTVLGQLGARESLAVEPFTLASIFGKDAAAVVDAPLDPDALAEAIRFATEHNCQFHDGNAGSFGIFVKMSPVGAAGASTSRQSAKPW
jgi:hypothetical protein